MLCLPVPHKPLTADSALLSNLVDGLHARVAGYAAAGVYTSALALTDAMLGWVAAVSWCSVASLYLKRLVGRPRPNYLALLQVVAQSPSLQQGSALHLGGNPNSSFPSGHRCAGTVC
jgi:membrane-associated phospholipid phosphatase